MRIGVVAPSAPVGQIELSHGVARLRELGLDVVVHPQTAKQHFVFAGTDQERAQAFYDFARDG
jgi:muramoyltetrapeptide carboxypeptidase LdcA involved in peptidoglycan recycling